MATVALPTTLVDRTVPTASDFNGNFNAILTAINGNLDTTNIDTTVIATVATAQTFSNKTLASPTIITSAPVMGAGTQKGQYGEPASGERTQEICRQNSGGNKHVAGVVYFPVPFLNATGLTITISDEYVYAPGASTNLSAGATKTTTNILDADNKVVGFSRSYQDNTNFTANAGHTVNFKWSAVRT